MTDQDKIQNKTVRETLLAFLKGGQAHADLDDALAGMPPALISERPAGSPYSAWQLLEHIRLTLEDLVEFSTNRDYQERKWPEEYWPPEEETPSATDWKSSAQKARSALQKFESMLNDPAKDLTGRIPWGNGQTLFREILLAIGHTSYHTGQLILVRKQLGAWKS
jgi:uncharacterized damage-inducible protein DinB